MANAAAPERHWSTELLVVLASFLCGFGVWVVVQLTETEQVVLTVAVRTTGVPDQATLMQVRPEQVQVRFSYPATESGKMQAKNFFVEVDLGDLVERIGKKLDDTGDRTLSPELVRADGFDMSRHSITPIDVRPLQVGWAARLNHVRAVVQPVVQGVPAAGFTYDAARVGIDGSNEVVVLLGAAKWKELQDNGQTLTIPTQPLDITGASAFVRQTVELDLPAGVMLLPGESIRRMVLVNVVEETRTRELEAVPVSYEFFTKGLRAVFDPPTVKVTLRGKLSAINAVTPGMIAFTVQGVAERAGEKRQVKLEARIADPALRAEIEALTVEPELVFITPEIAKPDPTATPSPTATPTPTPVPSQSPSPTPAPSPTPEPSTPTAIPNPEPTPTKAPPPPTPTEAAG